MQSRNGRGWDFLLGAAAGAALMFLLDPRGGARRRALARDRALHEVTHLRATALGRARDLRNRARGLVMGTRTRVRPGRVDDVVLEARVRARLGHLSRHAGGLRVTAHDGTVTLAGPLPAGEADRLTAAVSLVPGVRDLVDLLQVGAGAS